MHHIRRALIVPVHADSAHFPEFLYSRINE
jgi:hypothetical protein